MPRGRQALKQEQVEQIAAALGLPPHKLTDELLEKPSVLALIGASLPDTLSVVSTGVSADVRLRVPCCRADSSAGNAAQLAEANPSSPQDPGRVAARAKVAATVAMAATRGKNSANKKGQGDDLEEGDRRRPARGRRPPRR